MALKNYYFCKITFFISILIFFDFHNNVCGLRILEGDKQWSKKNTDLIIQSLPRGPVPSKGASPCTNIPGGRKKGRCMLAQNEGKKIIASQIYNHEHKIISENNDTQKQEQSHS
ncbi:hypothetical protein K7X08_030242 [Anisodus acutangulus]|uniref:Uncharacterized protein n=1 Tax=Anisodus acutangulus TaxID=402998 RepID=A0A9Q1R371_9SOLA|nr:hypothetical protein K7X08_030242 [Anisodus acutangulus]